MVSSMEYQAPRRFQHHQPLHRVAKGIGDDESDLQEVHGNAAGGQSAFGTINDLKSYIGKTCGS